MTLRLQMFLKNISRLNAVMCIAIMSFGLNAFAVEFDECQYRMEKVKRSARDADISVEKPSDVQEALSILNEVQTNIDKARRECGDTLTSLACNEVQSYARTVGIRAALAQCRATRYESIAPDFCRTCLGVR